MGAIKRFFKSVNLNNLRAALYPWLFNVFFSIIAYAGFYTLFSGFTGNSLLAAEFGNRPGVFSFLVDIIYNYNGGLPLLFFVLFLLLVLFLPVSIFLSGGIYAVLIEERKTTFTNLFYASSENFFPMLKVFLVNCLNWAVALIIPVFSMVLFRKPGIYEINESLFSFFIFAWFLVSALILIFSLAIYDFSRISRLQQGRNFLYAFKEGILLTFSNKLDIFLLFLLYGGFLVFIYLVYLLFSSPLENCNVAVLIFPAYQVFIFLRYFLKVMLMQAEVGISASRCEEE